MQLDEWNAIAERLGEVFPNSRGNAGTLAAYFAELQSFDADLVEAEARDYAVSEGSEWFPSLGVLYQRCRKATEQRAEQKVNARSTIGRLGLPRALEMYPEWRTMFPDVVEDFESALPVAVPTPVLETPAQVEARLLAEANERAGAIPGSPAEIKSRIKELGAP